MSKFSLRDVLSGDILTKSWFQRQFKVIGLISVLIFIYIHCGYLAQQQQRTLSKLQKELQDVQLIQLSLQAELMEKTRQSSISKMLQEKESHIKPSQTPAIRIL
jgi:hypothetical protein